MSSELRCWQCGVEPLEVFDISTIGQMPGSQFIPGRWPAGDHPHAQTPPTPTELVEDGHRRLRRILEDW